MRLPIRNALTALPARPLYATRPSFTVLQPACRNISAPRITDRSIWESIIPKFLRKRSPKQQGQQGASKSPEWNPATFFIVIFIIIGSNAVNMIAIRRGAQSFSRKTEQRIAQLKEAIERVQSGEKVDVKKLLGTGNPADEQDWEEAMREIEAAVSAESKLKEQPDSNQDNEAETAHEEKDTRLQPRFY